MTVVTFCLQTEDETAQGPHERPTKYPAFPARTWKGESSQNHDETPLHTHRGGRNPRPESSHVLLGCWKWRTGGQAGRLP